MSTEAERIGKANSPGSGRKALPTIVAIFGATGDLFKRKLVPALYNLRLEGGLPDRFHIVGIARRGDEAAFLADAREGLEKYSRSGAPEDGQWEEFAKSLAFILGKLDDPATFRELASRIQAKEEEWGEPGARLYYLSVPPSVFGPIADGLGAAGLAQARDRDRIVVEKPFGHDPASSEELNHTLRRTFEERQIYRIDHYLGKETVQNLLAFRFANALYEPIWQRAYVDHVQITVAEDVGVGSRGGYYEGSGALRDMVQNHLLQLLCLIAMEPPTSLSADEVRNKKVDVLHAVRAVDPALHAVRAQYAGYRQEQGVAPDSATETFAALELYVDNWRWQDVPFYLRTGKGLPSKLSQIHVHFRPVPHQSFTAGNGGLPEPNTLVVNIQPREGIVLRFQAKVPGGGMRLLTAEMEFCYETFGTPLREAYETLLEEAIEGDPSLFMRADQEAAAWSIVAPVLDAWSKEHAQGLPEYPLGSWGPEEADELLARSARNWFNPDDGD